MTLKILNTDKFCEKKIILSHCHGNSAKQKILQEHDQNMTAINNQLQMSKLRQRKA